MIYDILFKWTRSFDLQLENFEKVDIIQIHQELRTDSWDYNYQLTILKC